MHIEYIGRDAIIETPEVSFTYQVSENPRDFESYRGHSQSLDWSNQNNYYGDYLVFPFGTNNDLPTYIKDIVQNNYIAPGLLNRKTELLWGSGPKLYKEVYEGNRPTRVWVEDKEIQKWLDKWEYEQYLLQSATDYQHLQGVFTKFELNKGSRIGKPIINELQVLQPDKSRLATLRANKVKKPTHVVFTDWKLTHASHIEDAKVYPLFDFRNPFSKVNSVFYSSKYTFCTDYYTVPEIYGSLEWLNRSTSVPLIFKALSKNSINLKYHIISPQKFWNIKESEIKQNCTVKQIEYKASMLIDYQTDFLKKMAKVLSGEDNTGKYLHTTKMLEVDGTNLLEHGWEIKVIDQNIKDFVEAQIKISQRADRAVASGISLHSALGNMSETGKVDSGSEQVYALISYLNTGIDIQEMIICKAINYAIKANFPDKQIKIGFYHNVPEKQQDISPADRSINNSAFKQSEK
jgi:hypothetical protein